MAEALLQPIRLGALDCPNRIAMAPLTRARASQPGDVPNELMGLYYAQRAGACFIDSEATNINRMAQGFAHTPGIYTDEQEAGWARVAQAVHDAGGRIVMQLWHVGRNSHEKLLGGNQPLSASDSVSPSRAWIIGEDGKGSAVESTPARSMTLEEIRSTVADYASAAERAIRAGLDGVEVHAANTYLPEQFLASESNRRDDDYGGTHQNRARFLLEVVDACIARVPANRLGVKLSPLSGIQDEDPVQTWGYVAQQLSGRGLAYLHVADMGGANRDPDAAAAARIVRPYFEGPLVVNGGLEPTEGRALIESGLVDVVAFGRRFIANPDLPERIRIGAPLADANRATFYGGGEKGYTDYPTYEMDRGRSSR